MNSDFLDEGVSKSFNLAEYGAFIQHNKPFVFYLFCLLIAKGFRIRGDGREKLTNLFDGNT